MEVKHMVHFPNLSLSLPISSPSSFLFNFKPWIHTKISIKKHFHGLAELWRFHVLQMLKPYIQTPNNKHHSSHHTIKRAQSLNSILRQYGVSIDLIAAGDKNSIDVDLLLKYQLLNTLAFTREHCQLIKRNGFSEEKPLTMLTAHGLPHAKSTGYFLVLVPLIALCITCLVGAFCTRVQKDNRTDALNESTRHKHQPKSTRWRHALSDSSETDDVASDSALEDEDEDENLFEDAYSKVENDYQKFLSECGISECGYQHRRGGIHQ